jgi:hypothetical protein
MSAWYSRQFGSEIVELGAIALGVPLTAIVAGWLLSGRQPSAIPRVAFE